MRSIPSIALFFAALLLGVAAFSCDGVVSGGDKGLTSSTGPAGGSGVDASGGAGGQGGGGAGGQGGGGAGGQGGGGTGGQGGGGTGGQGGGGAGGGAADAGPIDAGPVDAGAVDAGVVDAGIVISAARLDAIARAKSGVGFSYWWGHGRWLPGGLTTSNAGSCTGNCPSCTHTGSYGADCSGYVGKIWQVPASNSDPTVDSHPYSTATFVGTSTLWRTVTLGAVLPADAFVYNNGTAGHIFLYESADPWGSMWAYEARGCATGIVHNIRTAGTAYKAIAHY